MKGRDRPTVGIITSNINWWYGNRITRGIRARSVELGVSLRFFCGGRFNTPPPFDIEASRNYIYSMISKENVDGIIVLSAGLCSYLTPAETARKFAHYAPLPVVGIGEFADGSFPRVLTDDKAGMAAMMRHLTGVHGYKKIAYISGPEENPEARHRLEAYLEVMEEAGLEPDPLHVVYGFFNTAFAKEHVAELLDRRHLSPEVIVCANDDMALGAVHELKRRGFNIPFDIAVTGFDDIAETTLVSPALTTVAQPFYKQGQKALDMVLELIGQDCIQEDKKQQSAPGETAVFPAELVVRRSCGCTKQENQGDGKNSEIPGERKLQIISSRGIRYQAMEQFGSILDFNKMMFLAEKNFSGQGIESFYISFYPGEQFGYPASAMPIKEGRLLIGFNGEKLKRYAGTDYFSIEKLVPRGDFKYIKNDHFIIYPLTSQGNYYGIIVLEYYEDRLELYDPLVERFCATLGMIKQINEVEDIVKIRTNELKVANNKLEENNEKLRELDTAKTNFMANISHELRTPLTMLLGPQESFLCGDYGKELLSHKRLHSLFTSMHTNSLRLLRLINTLLDFSKIEAGKMTLHKEKTELNSLVEYYVNSIHSGVESRGLSIELICTGEKLLISLDRSLFEKAFFNLISNAMKFSDPGRTITVEVKKEAEMARVSVTDRGIGIPPGKLETIFERFTQVEQSASRKFEGTGIGLAFTKEIIELHKGSITVESIPGEGSVFTINLPYDDDPKSGAAEGTLEFEQIPGWLAAEFSPEEALFEEPDNPEERAGGRERELKSETDKRRSEESNRREVEASRKSYILIVDDNRTIRSFIRGLLENTYSTATAVNGKEALKLIEEREPALIISDIMMPEMDGLELCRIVKENSRTAHIPLILLTARMDFTTRLEGLESRADDYLIKPFNSRELFTRVRNLLEKSWLEQHLKALSESLWSEMETAQKIQNSLLPENPVIPGFEIACFLQSTSKVSGDYYDIIQTGNTSWLVIGDVSGHGVTAGLVMMMVQTAINTALETNPDLSPARLLAIVNRTVKNNISKLGQEKYMTISVFALMEKGRFLFSGLHQDIFIYRAATGGVDILETEGMWIGFVDDISELVKDNTFTMEKGDTLLLYTDGITEAVRKTWSPGEPGKRFGEAKLIKTLKAEGANKPEEIKKVLINELEHYICDDDFTFLIVRRL